MYRRTISLGLRQANLKNILKSLIIEFEDIAKRFNLALCNNNKLPVGKKTSSSKPSGKYLQKLKKVLNVALLDPGGYISSTLRAYAPLENFPSEAGHDICMALSSFDYAALEHALKGANTSTGDGDKLFDANLEESDLTPPLRPKSRFRI